MNSGQDELDLEETARRIFPARITDKINFNGPYSELCGSRCWVWLATSGGQGNYGQVSWLPDGRRKNGAPKMVYVHRLFYAELVGPITLGKEVDHKCLNKRCCNPLHLRIKTHKENTEHYGGPTIRSSSGVRGVYRDTKLNKWAVCIGHNYKRTYFGAFDTLAEAETVATLVRNILFSNNTIDQLQEIPSALISPYMQKFIDKAKMMDDIG